MGSEQITYNRGRAQRGIPTAQSDGLYVDERVDRHGHQFVLPTGKFAANLATSEAYFTASNPTAGTGIAGIAAADGYDAEEALCIVRNTLTATSAAASDKQIVLDYIKLQTTAAGTNGSNQTYATFIEPGPTTRWSSGGSTLTAVNPNASSSGESIASVRFGALVTTTASADERKLSSGVLRTVITVVGDVVVFDFGAPWKPNAHVIAGTAIAHQIVKQPPVVLGAGAEFLLHVNAASQSGATSFEVEVGWWEV